MKFSVFTASTPEWSPQEAVTHLVDQGWDGIEWRITDQEASETVGFWAGNRATWPLTGLEELIPALASVTRPLALSAIGGYVRCDDHENVERILTATALLGAGQVRILVPRSDEGSYPDLFRSTRCDLERAVTRAAELGVKILVELHHETITASASAAFRLLEGLDPARIGVIHDFGNLLIEGRERTRSAFELLGPYLAHIHVKNVVWLPGAIEPDGSVNWRHEWAPLRSGMGDVREYFRDLRTIGYDGWITCEDFSTEIPLAERTAANLAYLRDAASWAERMA